MLIIILEILEMLLLLMKINTKLMFNNKIQVIIFVVVLKLIFVFRKMLVASFVVFE